MPRSCDQGRRWHQTLEDRILLDNSHLPGELKRQVDTFVEPCKHTRYFESLDYLTPVDVYRGRAEAILAERQRIEQRTIENRCLQHELQPA